MIFNLRVMRNGQEELWTYDNITNTFADAQKQDPIPLPSCQNTSQAFSIKDTFKYNRQFDLLEIMLGAKCNFDCVYCSQRTFRDNVYSSSPKDVDKFCALLSELKIVPDNIQLWGGEPLVYWKTLEVLIPELRKIWPDSFCNLITNGSLLTKDKIDFFKKHEVAITVSYDCSEETARTANIGHDPKVVECLKYAYEQLGDMFAIWVTVTPGNTDFDRIESHLNELIGDVRIVYYPLKCATQSGMYSKEEQKRIEDKLFEIINTDDQRFNFGAVDYHAQMLIHRMLSHAPIERATSHCQFPYSHGILASLDGSVWNCHIRPEKIGHLRDIPSGKVSATGLNDWTNYDYCHKCPWIHNCGGTCHTLPKDRHLLVCQNFRPWYQGILKGVFARLFGVYVESIEYDLPESKTIPIAKANRG